MAHAHAHPIPHDLFTLEIPPSPTLTNPDMILPYQPHLRSTPPPPLASSVRLPSPPPARPDSAVSLTSPQPDLEASVELGVATAVRMPVRAVSGVSPGYWSYEHGAPLSDIGEEETPRSKKSRRTGSPTGSDPPPSPTPVGSAARALRSLSPRSTSSNDSDDLGSWEDFDSSKIMNERLAAEVAKVPDDEVDDPESKRNSAVAANPVDEMALLNARAERILENARKRLTHMEDNLSKARHSVLLSSRSSPNMNELHQPAGGLYRSISLVGATQRKSRPHYPVGRANTVTHARGGSDSTSGASGLKRLSIIPETRSASALEYGQRQESPLLLQTSPSVRLGGFSPASNRSFDSPLRALKEEEGTPSTTKTSPETTAPRGLGITTLAHVSRENLVGLNSSPPTAVGRSSSAMSNRSTKEIKEQMSDLRARISDLKDKAQADSMRRRSLLNMRTPSPFGNDETPEQWYSSAPEYHAAGSPINANAGLGWSPSQHRKPLGVKDVPITPQAQTYLAVEQPTTNDSRLWSEARTDKNTPSLHKSVHVAPEPLDLADSVIQESHYEDAAQDFDEDEPVAASEEEQVYLNEVLQESLQEVEPEVPQLPEHLLPFEGAAGRHEDRLDAFDYENMFLHSALGNYTGAGTRSETSSDSDGSSVKTTRMEQTTPTADREEGEVRDHRMEVQPEDETSTEEEVTTPIQENFHHKQAPSPRRSPLPAPPKPWMKAARSNSMDSTSTVATFATATEGDGEDDDDDEEEDGLPTDILGWGKGIGFPQPPMSPLRENSASVWPTPPLGVRARSDLDNSPRKIQSHRPVVSNGNPTPPDRAPEPANQMRPPPVVPPFEGQVDHPANTEILMESLIKLADPDSTVGQGPGSVTFSDVDKELVLDLLRAVGGVCNHILLSERNQQLRATRVLRRRLDESRKLLEGREDE